MIDQWYEQYSAEITRFVQSKGFTPEDAEDLCSQVFLEAVQRQPADIAPRAWLYLVARNRMIDRRRHEARRLTAPIDEQSAADDGVEERVLENDEQAQLELFIGQLAPSHQQVLRLRFVENLSLREVARVLSTTVGTIKGRQARAQRALRRLIDPPEPEPIPAPVACEPEPEPEPEAPARLDNYAALLARCLRLEQENHELRRAL